MSAVPAPLIEMVGIGKSFPGVRALHEVSFDCRAGEVHALVGENGAGKSTLIKMLSGLYHPDSGEIRIDGETVDFRHPVDALRRGISVIYQEFSLLPHRSVAQNLFLGREPVRWGLIDAAAMRRETRGILALFGQQDRIDPDTMVADLDVATQQLVEIAKAISLDARVVVMDEPTAALNDHECEALFGTIDQLRSRGTCVIYITHRMREVTRLADRVTVLKDGEVSARFDGPPAPEAIVQAMVGRDIESFFAPAATAAEIAEVVLRVEGGANARLHDIAFDLRRGEILGLAGIQGAGRGALAMALFGAQPFTSGRMTLNGVAVAFNAPRDAIAAGIGLLPGDRKAEGLVLRQTVIDNGMLTPRAFDRALGTPGRTRAVDTAGMHALLDRLDVRAAGYDVDIGSLSGGNQQKAIIARWLAMAPRVLIFVEPTRGIDVNAKAAIYHLMRDLARAGTGILMVSSDLPEVIGCADRILVMRDGGIVGSFGHGPTEAEVMLAATGDDATTGAAA